MVMEFLEGRDLGELVAREGARSPAEAVDYVLQASEGVAEAHARGIVHRDLKPQNLFVTKRLDGTSLVKVLDFGLAKSLATTKEMRALTQTTAVMGSPVYMSPEQMRASRTVDARSDTWSLGVCLHELLTGRPPFEGATFPELCSMVLNEPPAPMPSDVPRGLAKIVVRCLEKNPARRFASLADLAEALEEFAPAPGAAARIRAILATPREVLESVPPPSHLAIDPNAETRSATSMDTVKRPHAARSRWPIVAAGVAACITLLVAALATRSARSTLERPPAPPSMALPTTTPAPPDSTSVAEAVPPTTATAAAPAPPAVPSAEPIRRAHPHGGASHRPAPPAAGPPPPASAPLLKPKTTDF
jgi:serine/threonine-protein kinase